VREAVSAEARVKRRVGFASSSSDRGVASSAICEGTVRCAAAHRTAAAGHATDRGLLH
jgi:hypothetical protein